MLKPGAACLFVLLMFFSIQGHASDGDAFEFDPGSESDPWEGWNRGVYQFNSVVDKWTLRPIARAYRWVLPSWGESAIQRFFANIETPVHVLNHALQGKWGGAAKSSGRFAVNTLMGFAGIFDVATPLGLIAEEEDFGQTLGAWGWRDSRYFVLPFMGPSTLRDAFGRFGDVPLDSMRYIDHIRTRNTVKGVELASFRAELLK